MKKYPSAFPSNVNIPQTAEGNYSYTENRIEPGMTLRDYFAAKAMQGMLANPKTSESMSVFPPTEVEKAICAVVYAMSDAMLEARKKGGES